MNLKKIWLSFELFAFPIATQVWAQNIGRGDWDRKNFSRKSDANVSTEIERKRVTIHQMAKVRKQPSIYSDEVEYDRVRRSRIDAKTEELIGQLETLVRREGQSPRKGELNMRLAELYYERAQAMAATESATWEQQIKDYDKLSENERKRARRPVLNTPRADGLRRKALNLYSQLESESRGADKGASRMIRRDEVLYFLGSTLLDLNGRAKALPHFSELVRDYPRSARAFAARLTLADLLFESGKYQDAISHFLVIAAGQVQSNDGETLKPYAMYKLAWCYLNTNQSEKAVKAFEKTLEISRSIRSERRVAFEKEALSDLAWAYAVAGQYKRGESYFDNVGDKELRTTFLKNSAEISRDRGEYEIAKDFFEKLLKEDPKGVDARTYALELADISKRGGQIAAYAKGLTEVGLNYSAGSDWLDAQDSSSDEKKTLVDEYVSLVRREAKALHSGAQKKDQKALYQKARPLYEAYFKTVPEPNPDTAENVHEMHFYFGELLFKLDAFKEAADVYSKAGKGKYGSMSAYARVVALKAGAAKDSDLNKELARATQDFVRDYPEDEKAGDILYSGAYDQFNAGQTAESISILEKLVDKFASSSRGVESAERILFIHEKKGDLDAGIKAADKFLDNDELVKAGGKEFKDRLVEYKQKANFKKVEKLAEDSDGEKAAKGQAYFALAQGFTGETKEKALNNAMVFAKKGGDKDLLSKAQAALLKEFPSSPYAKDLYFVQGEAAAKTARWSDALKNYDSFLKAYKKESPEGEKALWNSIYIRAHLEDVALPRLNPSRDMSADLRQDCADYLNHYPKGPNREEVISYVSLRKGVTLGDLKNLEKLPSLSKDERATLNEAETIIKVRNNQDLEGVIKKYASSEAPTELLREALAVASFNVVEPKYKKYRDQKIDYRPARFGDTLQSKLGALEKLEKDYLRVVSFGNGELALRSLERLSGLYRAMAGDIERAPEAAKDPALKAELDKYSKPIFEKGVGFLRSCLEKAVEYKIGGAGLEACRSEMATIDPNLQMLGRDQILDPRWVPSKAASDRPLFKSSVEAFVAGRLGEFSLGASLLDKAEPPMSPAEKAEINNILGLWNWRVGKGQAAVKLFRDVSDLDGSEFLPVRTAAFKNLAALYMSVGDYAQASEILKDMKSDDLDVAMLLGLSLKAQRQYKEAAQAFDRALSKNKNNMLLTYNKAIALGESGSFAEAIRLMQAYVERELPSASHPSRAYLKKWKAMVK